MPLVTCPVCGGYDLTGVDKLADGRLVVRCKECDHEWTRGESKRVAPPPVAATYKSLKVSFPTKDTARPEIRPRGPGLVEPFLQQPPELDPQIPPYRARYQ